jgi:hypothetical protein
MAKTPSLQASARVVLRARLLSHCAALPFVRDVGHMLQAMPPSGISRTARFPVPSVVHLGS